jgi:hypothetical protein
MLYGPYASYANGPDTVAPMPEWQDLLHAARVDMLVKDVLKRVESVGMAAAAVAVPATPTPFGDGAVQPPFAEEPLQEDAAGGAFDMFEPPEGGPTLPDGQWNTGADMETYRIIGATPFDGPMEQPMEQFAGGLDNLRVTREAMQPLERAIRPTFDTYSRFGYPDLKADPYGNGIINAIRRMVRGAQA